MRESPWRVAPEKQSLKQYNATISKYINLIARSESPVKSFPEKELHENGNQPSGGKYINLRITASHRGTVCPSKNLPREI